MHNFGGETFLDIILVDSEEMRMRTMREWVDFVTSGVQVPGHANREFMDREDGNWLRIVYSGDILVETPHPATALYEMR
jgi:hypothetical protein